MPRDFGKQIEHWNGVDVSANARLQNGLVLQGGFSTGETTTDNCAVLASQLEAVAGVRLSPPRATPSQRACHVAGPTDGPDAGQVPGTYLLPRVDVNLAATFQSVPGPLISANSRLTNAQIQPSLGRPLSAARRTPRSTCSLPGDIYGDRANQLDCARLKTFGFGGRRASVNLDIYNMFNATR